MLIRIRRAVHGAEPGAVVKRPLAPILFLLLALCASGCSRDAEPVAAYSGPLYPGAGLYYEFDDGNADNPFVLAAEFGDIYRDGGRIWYNAPLSPQADTYSISDAASGKTLATGEITVDMLPVADLELLEAGANEVSGRYGDVAFEATGYDSSRGTAAFTMPGSGETLTVTIDGSTAALAWNGTSIDGYGALSGAERDALRSLSTHPMARALTMVALDLGCRDEAASLDDAASAALLFPWQVILKYEVADRGRAIPHFLAESGCSFSGFREDGADEPINVAVLWGNSNPIPATLFLFPFDGEGQAEARP